MTDDRSRDEPGAEPSDDFVAVAAALASLSAELGLAESSSLRALEERWDEVVGADVAEHTRLQSLRDGVATIVADSPLWASQLRYLEGAIVAGAAHVVGAGVVSAAKVIVVP